MTALSQIIQTDAIFILLLCALFLTIGQLYLSIRHLILRWKSWSFVLCLIHFCQLGMGMCFLLDGIFMRDEARTPVPEPVNWIYSLPWILIAAWEIVSAVLCIILGINGYRYEKTHLSDSSIKDAVDLLPQGLCIIDASGRIRLANLRIHELSRQLTGYPLTDATVFLESLDARAKEYEIPDEIPGNNAEQKIISLDHGIVYLITIRKFLLHKEEYRQVTMSDITQQSRIIQELSDKNAKQLEVRQRMKDYQSQASRILMEQELLNARIAVHDGLGSLLLHCKYYLEHPQEVEEEQLLSMLKETNYYLLQEAAEPSAGEDIYRESLAAAARMGIFVEIQGDVPAHFSRDILGRTIRECAANAKKHAGSTHLFVTIEEKDSHLLLTITNDGIPPKEAVITETGGLKSLRQLIEAAGGTMQIKTAGRFILSITLSYTLS